MTNTLYELFDIVKERKENFQEGSYTCYLFSKGMDKILKKCGEECTEMVIAAKNKDKEEIANETCDLIYHMLVMLAEAGVEMDSIVEILEERKKKIGNLKQFRQTDKNT